MTNKRDLKKQIRYACGEIAAECILARLTAADDAEYEKWNDIVLRIAELQLTSLEHCTFSFDKAPRDFENRKAYRKALATFRRHAYNHLREEFNAEVAEIVKAMNALLPGERREANKAAAK